MLTWEIAVLVIVFGAAASFFCALAEAALFSLGRWRVQQLAENSPRAAMLQNLLKEPAEVLAAIVLGNTFANAAMVGEYNITVEVKQPMAATANQRLQISTVQK